MEFASLLHSNVMASEKSINGVIKPEFKIRVADEIAICRSLLIESAEHLKLLRSRSAAASASR